MNKLLVTISLCLITILAQAQDRRTIDVSGFDGVSLGGSGKVYVTQGNDYKVEFVGSDELFEIMKFEVRGNNLSIGRKNNSGWGKSYGRYEVYVTMPKINSLRVSGSGDLEVENVIKTNSLDLAVSGSGHLRARAEADDVDISVSGSGKVELEGRADEMDAHISGSGSVDGKGFTVGSVDAKISGSGNVYVNATESIESSISGSGSIYYSGDPKKLNNRSSGSGKIKKM